MVWPSRTTQKFSLWLYTVSLCIWLNTFYFLQRTNYPQVRTLFLPHRIPCRYQIRGKTKVLWSNYPVSTKLGTKQRYYDRIIPNLNSTAIFISIYVIKTLSNLQIQIFCFSLLKRMWFLHKFYTILLKIFLDHAKILYVYETHIQVISILFL